jgi:uncharacterized protein DUF1194
VLDLGVTINGLPIMIDPTTRPSDYWPGLDQYYEDCVIGGTNAFVLPIAEIEKFSEAVRQKLLLEVAARTPLVIPVSQRASRPRVDCPIFEQPGGVPF